MDFNFEFGFFSYLIDWFGFSSFSDTSAPAAGNINAGPIGG